MIHHELPLDDNLSERFPSMQFDFPYIWIWGELRHYIGGRVPWHWHEELEFCYVVQGEIEYHLPDQVHVLKAGDAMFVNSNVLHMICPHNGCTDAIITSQIFNKLLLIGYHHSVFDQKYYRPIANSSSLPCFFMHSDTPAHHSMIQALNDCYALAQKESPGYEIHVRNLLSSIWITLFDLVAVDLRPQESAQDKNNLRIKQILVYISEHYHEKLTLSEMANAASISERECIRCFNKYMHTTPFQYLMQYRIDSACNLLLHTDASIIEIAMRTGFESSSYFSKVFKRFTQYTPKSYRSSSRENVCDLFQMPVSANLN